MTDHAFHTLDVFTDRTFGGNPLAVFPDARGIAEDDLQRIARELNLSETVFVHPPETPEGSRRIRIFTPGREVPFAGHPTVGTALHLVAAELGATGEGIHAGAATHAPTDPAFPRIVPAEMLGATGSVRVVLEEGVGPVTVDVAVRDGRAGSARLTAAVAPTEIPFEVSRAETASMVGLAPEEVGFPTEGLGPFTTDRLGPVFGSAGLEFLVVPVVSRAAAARAALDTALWSRLLPEGSPSRMVYLVAPLPRADGDGCDFHVRMFAPDIGVPEDPATGSACAALGGVLGMRLAPGGYRWRVDQGIEMGRPSTLMLDVEVGEGDDPASRVRSISVGGPAVHVSSGVMRVPDRG